MGLAVSNSHAAQMYVTALGLSARQFVNGDMQSGRRYFDVIRRDSPEMEHEVYRQLWQIRGEPMGNPHYGEQCFHHRNGLSASGQEIAQAIVNYLATLNPVPESQGSGTANLNPADHPTLSTDFFYCPISHELLRNPLIDSCGHTFESEVIVPWVEQHHSCPISREPLELVNLTPNRALREAIEAARLSNSLPSEELTYDQRFNIVVNSNMRLIRDFDRVMGELQNSRIHEQFLVGRIAVLSGENLQLQQSATEQTARTLTLESDNQTLSAENRDLQDRLRQRENTILDRDGTIQQQDGTIRRQGGELCQLRQTLEAANRSIIGLSQQIVRVRSMTPCDGFSIMTSGWFGGKDRVINTILNGI